jgi:hypothetical protein
VIVDGRRHRTLDQGAAGIYRHPAPIPDLSVCLAAVEPFLDEPDAMIDLGVGQAGVQRRDTLLRPSGRAAGEGDEGHENRSNQDFRHFALR